MCTKVNERVDHIVSCCTKLTKKQYKRRHDKLGKIVHPMLARKCNFEGGDKWYEHEPEHVLENKDYKILWDFSIQTDHVIEAWRPEGKKKETSCKITDFAIRGYSRIEQKEKGKIEKYQDLGRELQKIWNVKLKILSLVVEIYNGGSWHSDVFFPKTYCHRTLLSQNLIPPYIAMRIIYFFWR